MDRPSKKDIKAALEKLKSPTPASEAKPYVMPPLRPRSKTNKGSVRKAFKLEAPKPAYNVRKSGSGLEQSGPASSWRSFSKRTFLLQEGEGGNVAFQPIYFKVVKPTFQH